jgi:diguanylate cyclase (GGDEF)-like protein
VPFLYKGNLAVQLIFRDITDRLLAKKRLEQLAHFDHLTMLPNRVLFFDRLSHLLEQAKRYDIPFALLFLDLDCFKSVNDSLGHAIGDLLLKRAAERLTACLRRSDTIARVGGDEFTVILSRINDGEDCGLVARKILDTFSVPFDLDGERRVIGVSIGISVYPLDGDDADTLLKKADTAMYRAKERGRNTYCYYGECVVTAPPQPQGLSAEG